jgi:hypothetical protein
MTNTEQIAAMAERIEKLEGALEALVEARALRTVLPCVARWNGPNGEYKRHPPRLDASIKTSCGAIYDLADALTTGKALLSSGDPQ